MEHTHSAVPPPFPAVRGAGYDPNVGTGGNGAISGPLRQRLEISPIHSIGLLTHYNYRNWHSQTKKVETS